MLERRMLKHRLFSRGAVCVLAVLSGLAAPVRAVAQDDTAALPATRWIGQSERAPDWTQSALAALESHASPLVDTVPADILDWCPGYARDDADNRRAFWVGFVSALSKHESTYNPRAVGGGGRWFGLLQILPGTARSYGCAARNGTALKNGSANLSCALRIMAVTVPRDGVIAQGMRGVAADWGPLHSAAKRDDMKAWLRKQRYCQPSLKAREGDNAAPTVDQDPQRG